jgi:uncharacterized protein YabN with tetrapyrrole methylase and pyrophosphatase domain
MTKVYEELDELRAAMEAKDADNISEELGDLLLTVTSLARKLGVESEVALCKATEKFIDRFEQVENAVLAEGKDINQLSMTELDAIWDKNKRNG